MHLVPHLVLQELVSGSALFNGSWGEREFTGLTPSSGNETFRTALCGARGSRTTKLGGAHVGEGKVFHLRLMSQQGYILDTQSNVSLLLYVYYDV